MPGICPFFSDVNGTSTAIKTDTVNCRGDACQIWNATSSICSLQAIGDLNVIETHVHRAHWHNAAHILEDITVAAGGAAVITSPPYASSIVQEWACFQDVDANHKVFGVDFKFIVNDLLPPALKGIQKNPDFNQNLPAISWAALYAWRYGTGPDPFGP